MEDVQKTLDAAEEALLRADAVRLAAFHAVEKAREALSLKAAGVAAGLLLDAAGAAATALKAAEIKSLEAWEETVTRLLARSIDVETLKR